MLELEVKVLTSCPGTSEKDIELKFQSIPDQDTDRIRLVFPSGRQYDFGLHDLQRVVKMFEVYDNRVPL